MTQSGKLYKYLFLGFFITILFTDVAEACSLVIPTELYVTCSDGKCSEAFSPRNHALGLEAITIVSIQDNKSLDLFLQGLSEKWLDMKEIDGTYKVEVSTHKGSSCLWYPPYEDSCDAWGSTYVSRVDGSLESSLNHWLAIRQQQQLKRQQQLNHDRLLQASQILPTLLVMLFFPAAIIFRAKDHKKRNRILMICAAITLMFVIQGIWQFQNDFQEMMGALASCGSGEVGFSKIGGTAFFSLKLLIVLRFGLIPFEKRVISG